MPTIRFQPSSLGAVIGRGVAWILLAVALLAVGCGEESTELTTAEMLEKLEGRTLTEAEVEERLALADLLCGFENRVLVQVWDRIESDQLEFQDWVFGEYCPDKLTAYTNARPDMGTVPLSTTTSDPDTEIDPDDTEAESRDTEGTDTDGTDDEEDPDFDPSIFDDIEGTPATFPEIDPGTGP